MRGEMFVSLLQAQGHLGAYLAFEKALRSGVPDSIEAEAAPLLQAYPGWNEVAICVARALATRDHMKGIRYLESRIPQTAAPEQLRRVIFQILCQHEPPIAVIYALRTGATLVYTADGLAAMDKLIRTTREPQLMRIYHAALSREAGRQRVVPRESLALALWTLTHMPESRPAWETLAASLPEEHDYATALQSILRIGDQAGNLTARDVAPMVALGFDAVSIVGARLIHMDLACLKRLESSAREAHAADGYLVRYLASHSASREAQREGAHGVALCMSGQLRDMAGAAPSIRKLLGVLGSPTIYVDTWTSNGVRFPLQNLAHISRIFDPELCQLFKAHFTTGEEVLQAYPSLDGWLKSMDGVSEAVVRQHYPEARQVAIHQDTFGNPAEVEAKYGQSFVPQVNQLRMYHLAHCGIEQAMADGNYDVLVRIRPDIEVQINPDGLKAAIAEVRANDDLIIVDAIVRPGMPSDSFAIGSRRAMRIYADLISMAGYYGDTEFYGPRISPHRILFDHLTSFGLRVERRDVLKIVAFRSPEITVPVLEEIIEKDRRGLPETPFEHDFRNLAGQRVKEDKHV